MKKISLCRVCKSENIKKFLDLGKQPYANSLLKNPSEKEKFYPLSLSYCLNCSLVQLNHTANPKELFSNYVWVTATSSTAREHANKFCKNIISRIKNARKGYVLEIASNDGTFLLPFIKKGYKVLGVDPAKNIVDMAIANNIPTKCEFFGETSAKGIKKEYGTASVVIARNVLPHVANTHDFVKGMSIALNDDGLLALEIHYAKRIYQELHYDSIYHEHLCYFTIKSLEKLLNQYNIFIEDLDISPISGGSLVVYARKKQTKESLFLKKYKKSEKDIKLNELDSWQNFAKKVKQNRKKLLEILNQNKAKFIVGYGASARSSTLLNYCGIGPEYIPIIADMNPLKQGLYTAGTHIPIENPDIVMNKKPDLVMILAWNFKDEIIKIMKEKYNYQGRYIIPLPNDPKIIK